MTATGCIQSAAAPPASRPLPVPSQGRNKLRPYTKLSRSNGSETSLWDNALLLGQSSRFLAPLRRGRAPGTPSGGAVAMPPPHLTADSRLAS
jgi:hypothetical protein